MSRRTPLVAALLALAVVAGCSSGSPGDDGPEAVPVTEVVVEVEPLRLELAGADLVSPHQHRRPLPDGVRDAAFGAVQAIFDATVFGPIVQGRAGDLAGLFTPDAARLVAGPDRDALVDAGLPAVTSLVTTRAEVELTALAGAAVDEAEVIVARIDWDVADRAGTVRVQRSGELGLVPGGDRGWRVASYTVRTTRTVAGTTTTTTTTTEAGA